MNNYMHQASPMRLTENHLGIVPLSKSDYERLKKQYEGQETVKTDMYGNVIRPYTLH